GACVGGARPRRYLESERGPLLRRQRSMAGVGTPRPLVSLGCAQLRCLVLPADRRTARGGTRTGVLAEVRVWKHGFQQWAHELLDWRVPADYAPGTAGVLGEAVREPTTSRTNGCCRGQADTHRTTWRRRQRRRRAAVREPVAAEHGRQRQTRQRHRQIGSRRALARRARASEWQILRLCQLCDWSRD